MTPKEFKKETEGVDLWKLHQRKSFEEALLDFRKKFEEVYPEDFKIEVIDPK